MSRIFLAGMGIALAVAAYDNGGVAESWLWVEVAIGLIASAYWLFREGPDARELSWPMVIACGLVVASVGLSVVPLPLRWLGWLSPQRAEIAEAAWRAGAGTGWDTLSVAPLQSVGYLIAATAFLLLFITTRNVYLGLLEEQKFFLASLPLTIVGAIEGGLGYLQAYSATGDGHARGTYAAYDHYSALLEMILPFPLLHGIHLLTEGRKRHESPARPAFFACVLFLAFVAILVGIVHSLSRSGFLAAVGSLFVMGVAYFSSRQSRDAVVTPGPWRRVAYVGTLLLLFCLVLIFLPTDSLLARFGTMHEGGLESDARMEIWRDSLRLVKEFPLFGVGLGGYESAFLRYKVVAPMQTVDYAHNDYLQLWIELGIVGYLPCLFLFGMVLYRSARAAVQPGSSGYRLFEIACIGSLAAIALHSLTDFNLYVPANAMVFFWVSGMAASALRGPMRR